MSILESLADYDGGRIVSFEIADDKRGVKLREECDGYFERILTKSEFGQMIAELQAMHGQMID